MASTRKGRPRLHPRQYVRPDRDRAAERASYLTLLRSMRQEAGYTQAGLSERLGQYRSYVGKYETGQRMLDVVELHQVCKAFRMTLADFSERLEAALV